MAASKTTPAERTMCMSCGFWPIPGNNVCPHCGVDTKGALQQVIEEYGEDYHAACGRRDRLIAFAADPQKTRIIDDDNDWYETQSTRWMSFADMENARLESHTRARRQAARDGAAGTILVDLVVSTGSLSTRPIITAKKVSANRITDAEADALAASPVANPNALAYRSDGDAFTQASEEEIAANIAAAQSKVRVVTEKEAAFWNSFAHGGAASTWAQAVPVGTSNPPLPSKQGKGQKGSAAAAAGAAAGAGGSAAGGPPADAGPAATLTATHLSAAVPSSVALNTIPLLGAADSWRRAAQPGRRGGGGTRGSQPQQQQQQQPAASAADASASGTAEAGRATTHAPSTPAPAPVVAGVGLGVVSRDALPEDASAYLSSYKAPRGGARGGGANGPAGGGDGGSDSDDWFGGEAAPSGAATGTGRGTATTATATTSTRGGGGGGGPLTWAASGALRRSVAAAATTTPATTATTATAADGIGPAPTTTDASAAALTAALTSISSRRVTDGRWLYSRSVPVSACDPQTPTGSTAAQTGTTTPPPLACLTVRQPYASLLCSGIKQAEGREWMCAHSGPLAILAAAYDPTQQEIDYIEGAYRANYGVTTFPRVYPTNALIGVVDIIGCLPSQTYEDALDAAAAESGGFAVPEVETKFAYVVGAAALLDVPIRDVAPQQKVFALPPKAAAAVRSQFAVV